MSWLPQRFNINKLLSRKLLGRNYETSIYRWQGFNRLHFRKQTRLGKQMPILRNTDKFGDRATRRQNKMKLSAPFVPYGGSNLAER